MNMRLTDEQVDLLLRRLDVSAEPAAAFVESGLDRLLPPVRAARREDTSIVGRSVAAILSARWRIGATFGSMPGAIRLAIAVALLLLALAGAIAVGSRLLRVPDDAMPLPVAPIAFYVGVLDPVLPESPEDPTATLHTGASLGDGRVILHDSFATDRRTLEVWDSTTGLLASVGRLIKRRDQPTLVPLRAYRVLVIGGDLTPPLPDGSSRAAPSTAEVLDLATGVSIPAGPMAASHAWPATAVLPDGRVLITGGLDDESWEPTASAELFDPATNSFQALDPMTMPRIGHSMVMLPDGRVFVSGGTPDQPGAPEIYEPETDEFAVLPAAPVATGTTDGPAVLTNDGRVALFRQACEEFGPAGRRTSAVDFYDPATDRFEAGLPVPNCVDTATSLPNGQILLQGYYWARAARGGEGCVFRSDPLGETLVGWTGLYDPVEGFLRETAPTRRFGLEAIPLPDGRVLFVGGSICAPSYGGSGELYR